MGNIDKIEDEFIRYNHEQKALKLAFKKLKTKINEKMLKAVRGFCEDGKNWSLLLGRKHCALILLVVEGSLVRFLEFETIDSISKLKLWGMPICVSMEDDYRIEIIRNFDAGADEWDLCLTSDPDCGLGKSPLVNMEDLINDLPDSMKFKKV